MSAVLYEVSPLAPLVQYWGRHPTAFLALDIVELCQEIEGHVALHCLAQILVEIKALPVPIQSIPSVLQ